MDLDGHRIVVTGLQGDKSSAGEVFDRISICGPDIVVRFEVIAKIRAKTAGYCCAKVGLLGDAFGSALQKRTEMEQTGSCCHRKDLITVKGPHEAVTHVHERGKSSGIRDGFRVGAIRDGWE
jgi:hypothetical protein